MSRVLSFATVLMLASIGVFASPRWTARQDIRDPMPVSPRWTQCAQHCGSFDGECACFIVLGGTCYVKLAGPGSCTGVECFDTMGHECGD